MTSMGQLVAVTEKPSTTQGVVRFELNRTLSGQGHERFASAADAYGPTPSDELARRLFSTGQVAGVHVYSNIVTVDLEKGFGSDGLVDVVRDMYQYWTPGVAPPTFDDLEPEEAVDDGAVAAAGGDTALTEAAKKVPMHLLVRAREARERWAAKSG